MKYILTAPNCNISSKFALDSRRISRIDLINASLVGLVLLSLSGAKKIGLFPLKLGWGMKNFDSRRRREGVV